MKKVTPINFAGFFGITMVVLYLFIYLKKVDISLIYSWQQSIPLSFEESLKIPGGLSSLLADLILESTTIPVLGSIFVALLLLGVFFSLKHIFRNDILQPFLPALLIAALIPFVLSLAHYRFPFELFTSLVMGLIIGMLYDYCKPGKLWQKLLCSFISAIILYMIAGVIGLIVLLQVMVIQALSSKRYADLFSILSVLLIPLLYLPFNLVLSVKQALLGSFIISNYDEIPKIFYFSLSSPILLFLGITLLNYSPFKSKTKFSLLIASGSVIISLTALVYTSLKKLDESDKNAYLIVQASFDKDWSRVLDLTREASSFNNLVQFEINRALYGSGILLDELYSYPQAFGETGLFLDGFSSSQIAIHTADFYYDLGFANETRHWATEAQMILVRHPIVLKQLVMSYIGIGQEESALKYLRVLSESRLYRPWTEYIFSLLERDEAGEDTDIRRFRENNPANDFFAGTKNPVQKIRLFYGGNRNNNMAFEYLIAGHLMKHNIGSVVFLLSEFKKQGYEKYPRAVEEALMIYMLRTGGNNTSQLDFSISKETVDRFTDFNTLMSKAESKSDRMMQVSKYRNTYWYYILFSSPYVTKK